MLRYYSQRFTVLGIWRHTSQQGKRGAAERERVVSAKHEQLVDARAQRTSKQMFVYVKRLFDGHMAELVDALVSGTSGSNTLEVRVFLCPP